MDMFMQSKVINRQYKKNPNLIHFCKNLVYYFLLENNSKKQIPIQLKKNNFYFI